MAKKKNQLIISHEPERIGLKHSAIWASVVVAVATLIGLFFGREGYIVIGLIIVALSLFSVLFISASTTGE